ncbi:bifunctional diguanylate cyclase/phosphodiesterase [Polycladidibacter hongkongensis]|uniref:bifunctional diguanylate cyclase/phosphodiesterase n=1 Tax=Polycladidibacter hongkongensis TaxID=1647556 RepID=UPI00082A0199|nr:EAL domain-containing protein [Pseudovibrio hongkongensis]
MPAYRPTITIKIASSAILLILITFTGLSILVPYQLENAFKEHSLNLEELARQQFSRLQQSNISFLSSKFNLEMSRAAREVSALAREPDFLSALDSGSYLSTSLVLRDHKLRSTIDAMIVFDSEGQILGTSKEFISPAEVATQLGAFGFFEELAQIIRRNSTNEFLEYFGLVANDRVGSLLPGIPEGALSEMIIAPILDADKNLLAIIVAQRWFRFHQELLMDLKDVANVDAVLIHNGKIVADTRGGSLNNEALQYPEQATGKLTRIGDYFVLCEKRSFDLNFCTMKTFAELQRFQERLRAIADASAAKTTKRVLGLGVIVIVFTIFAAVTFARNIAKPLKDVTRVIAAVAEGDYGRDIKATQRSDEVGDIARAAAKMQRAVEERDSLRLSLHTKNVQLSTQERQLAQQNVLFETALDNMLQGLCIFDSQRRLLRANKSFACMFAAQNAEPYLGLEWEAVASQLAINTTKTHQGQKISLSQLWRTAQETQAVLTLANGRTIEMSVVPMESGMWLSTFEDTTERKRASDHLAYLATHDNLTRLPNRLLMHRHLTTQMQKLKETNDAFGIVWLDLDEFKTINDSLGHAFGDRLLCHVADTLRANIGEGELVARLGGDEFAIVTSAPISREFLEAKAKRILNAINSPCVLQGHEVIVSASIGVVLVDKPQDRVGRLLRFADLALYKAKESGRNTLRFFEESMEANIRSRQELSTDLHHAIAKGEMWVAYQPQIDLKTAQIVGFEALLRWDSPKHGRVSPADFIPLAEDTGAIVDIGLWVLTQACEQAAKWPANLTIAVNLSAKQIQSPELIGNVDRILAQTGLPTNRLELEITETSLLQDNENNCRTIKKLRKRGILVALDDFGTGYSSLSILTRFRVDKIKIDRSFVGAMLTDDDSRFIVEAIIKLALTMSIRVIAEGVENEQTKQALWTAGCVEAQGYYFSKPVSADKALELLKDPYAR